MDRQLEQGDRAGFDEAQLDGLQSALGDFNDEQPGFDSVARHGLDSMPNQIGRSGGGATSMATTTPPHFWAASVLAGDAV